MTLDRVRDREPGLPVNWRMGLSRFLPFPLIILTLAIILWVTVNIFQRPYSGMTWIYQTGTVATIDAGGPAAPAFRLGDRILSIDGVPVYQARGLPGYHAGDKISILAQRGQDAFQAEIALGHPPLSIVVLQLSPIFVALTFWALGLFVFVLGRSSGLTLFFLVVCEILTNILTLGDISAFGPSWCSTVFSILLWWIGPLLIHLHLLLIEEPEHRPARSWLGGLYAAAVLLSLANLTGWLPAGSTLTQAVKYIWLSLTLITAAAMLIWSSSPKRPIEIRQRARIIGLAALVAFVPFIAFSLVPEIVFNAYLFPYEITFLALPALPLGYCFAILRYRLIRLEHYVNRSAKYALGLLMVGILYSLTYFLIPMLIPNNSDLAQAVFIGINILLIIGVSPLYRVIQHWLDKLFYGGWYDDRNAARQISQTLVQAKGDLYSVASSLCITLQKSLQLEYVNLLLPDGKLVSTRVFNPPLPAGSRDTFAQLSAHFTALGQFAGPGNDLSKQLPLSKEEKYTVIGSNPQFWVLLVGKHSVQGLLILGNRRGGGEYAPRDLDILDTVLRQAGAGLESIALLGEVRELHHQVINAREEERKRVSRDLHDKIIQALVGVQYQITSIRETSGDEQSGQLLTVQRELRSIMYELRQICADLRPPILDSLGFISAIQSRVDDFSDQASFEISLEIDELGEVEPPEMISLCFYRFVQEGLINIQKHAAAQHVNIRFTRVNGDEIQCQIKDDGVGFTPPEEFAMLTQQRHFGLVGLKEQVEALNGCLKIESAAGEGCCLSAVVPLVNQKQEQMNAVEFTANS